MRMETNTERYEGFEQIFDGVQECPVDTEYTLPDYCADIQKILKCIVTPEVTSVSAAGDSLTIDGCASMHVLYLDAKGGCVRGFDTKKEFTCSVRLRAQAENVTAEAEPFVQHITCRAMNAAGAICTSLWDFPCVLTPCGSLKLQTAFRMTVWKQSAKNTMLPAPWAA